MGQGASSNIVMSGQVPSRDPTLHTPNGQKFIAVTSRRPPRQHGKLVRMCGEARVEKSETTSSYQPVAGLEDYNAFSRCLASRLWRT
jgi:hypothetical protein